MDLEGETVALQRSLAQIDLLTGSRSKSGATGPALLLAKLQELKLRIHQERGHALPHIHIDYGREHHAASYGIAPAVRLAGNLPNKYDRTVREWIEMRSGGLRDLWDKLQAGEQPTDLEVYLRGDADDAF